MAEVENHAMPTSAAEIEPAWEFDAPRFRDFENGTPPGESADDWFNTEATRGLATPLGAKPNTKNVNVVNEEYLEMSSQMDPENQSQQPSSQKAKVSSQTDPVEAEHVRAVLAHITNNKAVSTQQQQVPAAAFSKKPTAPKVEAPVVKRAKPASHKKQQQPTAPVPLKSNVAVSENKKTTVPAAASAPVPAIAPSSSRPATRATNQNASRTTRAAVGSAVTRARDPPRVRAPITKKATAPAKKQQPQRSKPQITVAKSPFLRSKQRSVTHRQQDKTTEELEMEKVEKAKQEVAALRRRNARTVGPALQGRTAAPPRPAPKRPPTEPVKEFNLRTAKRQRVHGMETRHQGAPASAPSPWKSTAQRVAEFTTGVATRQTNQRQRPVPRGGRQQQQQRGRAELTVPRTPRFATKTRARASRFKPTEELEAEKAIAEAQAVKVRQKKETERANNAVAPAARRRSERKPLTEFKPFSFATDVRAAQRSTRPAAELPVFVFGAEENGPVTRSRAHIVSTTAPYAAAAAAPRSARRELTAVQQHQQYQQAIEQQEEEYHYQQQRPDSGNNNELFSAGAASNAARRRRTTAGPMQLGRLGGAVRVLRQEQEEHPSSSNNDDDDCCTEEQDGMQAIIRAGATLGMDRTTLHNPLFHAA